jgi:transcriptional regulator with XRE-family HTH domain
MGRKKYEKIPQREGLIVGPMIKERREELGMTQNDLGRALGYKYGNFIGMLENGNALFPLERWEDYAEALKFKKHEFLEAVMTEKYPSILRFVDFHPEKKGPKKSGKKAKKSEAAASS